MRKKLNFFKYKFLNMSELKKKKKRNTCNFESYYAFLLYTQILVERIFFLNDFFILFLHIFYSIYIYFSFLKKRNGYYHKTGHTQH